MTATAEPSSPRSGFGRVGRVVAFAQPFVLAAAILLGRWTVEATSLDVLIRPMVVLALLSAVALLLARLVTGSWPWAILIADAVILFTLRELWPAFIILAAAIGWGAFWLMRRALGRPQFPPRVSWAIVRASGIFAVVLFAVSALGAGSAVAAAAPETHMPSYAVDGRDAPNIYVVLLDGYPRADTLADDFGFDNRPFLDDLADLGFEVADDARTNYNKTWLTLASMLNGAYVEDLLGDQDPPDDPTAELRWLDRLIDESAIPAALHDAGYAIRTIPSAYTSAEMSSADEVIDSGEPNEFEVRLIATSPWTTIFRDAIVGYLVDAQAQRVRHALDATTALAEAPPSEPQFVLTHVHSPHTPFVLGRDVSAASAARCFPLQCTFWEARLERLGIGAEEYKSELVAQVEQLNEWVIETVEAVVSADPEAVVIVMSDHGMRFEIVSVDEHYRSLLATRTPGHPGLFAEDESPVNLLRGVLDAYLGADAGPLRYRAWSLDWTYNLRLVPIDPEPS